MCEHCQDTNEEMAKSKEIITDLLYFEDAGDYQRAWDELAKAFPESKIEDASDMVHRYRFSFQIPRIKEREFYKKLIRSGMAMCSLSVQFAMRENGDRTKELESIIDELNKEDELCDGKK